MIVIVSAIAELERSLIIERVRAGMRRARLEGRRMARSHWILIEKEYCVIAVLECHPAKWHGCMEYRRRRFAEY